MGKIIQIATAGHTNTSQTQSDWTLFALDDNGRLWSMSSAHGWSEIPLPVVVADVQSDTSEKTE